MFFFTNIPISVLFHTQFVEKIIIVISFLSFKKPEVPVQ